MDEMTQQNAALVEQAAASSQSMAQQAQRLSESVARYRIDTMRSGAFAGHGEQAQNAA
jgi:methyl-accepting chemotaxis protein